MSSQKPSLSREKIVDAAVRIFERDGLDALTARKLATELGVSQMAMYRYFDGMAEIHGELVERVVRLRAASEQQVTGWAERLVEVFTGIRLALLASPDLLSLLGNTAHVGPQALAVVEQVLQILRSAGFDPETAAVGFHTLLSYTLGSCGLHNTANAQLTELSDLARAELIARLEARLDGAADEGLEEVARHKTALAGFMSDERFDGGLRVIIRGLERHA